MHRLIYLILFILIVTALMGGIRIGKKLQMVDTPIKTVQKIIRVTDKPQALVRYTLSCGFFFAVPKNIIVRRTSTSATITIEKNTLKITCVPANTKISSASVLYKKATQNSAIEAQGEQSLLKLIEPGFDPLYIKTVL